MPRPRPLHDILLTIGTYAAALALGAVLMWVGMNVAREDDATARPDPLRARPAEFDWSRLPPPEFPLPPYAKHLHAVLIVLDPGHGGRGDRAGWKRGPTGLREAEVNLRVALQLREFLEAAGARVLLTRDDDVYLDANESRDLQKRAALANHAKADLFLSLHHNGVDNAPQANYTCVFYHGPPEHSPASLDVAGHVLTGLNDALRLEQHTECGLASDYSIFPGRGFAVLRETRVPAVLTEGSFHSNPQEEARLRQPVYNRREAYGLFLGLARWARAGLPRITLAQPADGQLNGREPIIVRMDDGLRLRGGLGMNLRQIRPETLLVECNGQPITHQVNWDKAELRIQPTRELRRRGGELRIDFENTFGQNVVHPYLELSGIR